MDRADAWRRVRVAYLLQIVDHCEIDVGLIEAAVWNRRRHQFKCKRLTGQVEHEEMIGWITGREVGRRKCRVKWIRRSGVKVWTPDSIEPGAFPGADQRLKRPKRIKTCTDAT